MKTLREFYGSQDTAEDHIVATQKWLKAIKKEALESVYIDAVYTGDIEKVINFLLTQIDSVNNTKGARV